jgi:hypothetical protein
LISVSPYPFFLRGVRPLKRVLAELSYPHPELFLFHK